MLRLYVSLIMCRFNLTRDIAKLEVNGTACLNISYIPQTIVSIYLIAIFTSLKSLSLLFSVNEKVYLNETVSGTQITVIQN